MKGRTRQNLIKKYFDFLYQTRITPWREHPVGPLYEEFLKILKKDFQGAKVLDIGCGDGWLAIETAKKSFFVWGIDSSKRAIDKAVETAEKEGVAGKTDFQTGDALDLPYKNFFFEALLDRGLFHHILPENRSLYLKNILRVLKKDSLVYLEAFSRKNPPGIGQLFSEELVDEIFGRDFEILNYKEDKYPPDTPAHLLHFILKRK